MDTLEKALFNRQRIAFEAYQPFMRRESAERRTMTERLTEHLRDKGDVRAAVLYQKAAARYRRTMEETEVARDAYVEAWQDYQRVMNHQERTTS